MFGFCDELINLWVIHCVDDLSLCLGDFNLYAGRHTDLFDGVRGGCSVSQESMEGGMLSMFCLDKELSTSNTCFKMVGKRKMAFGSVENGGN